MYKIKNKSYQPIPLILKDGSTVVLTNRSASIDNIADEDITPQMLALKSAGQIQIIKK
jgi:hypothetical protein